MQRLLSSPEMSPFTAAWLASGVEHAAADEMSAVRRVIMPVEARAASALLTSSVRTTTFPKTVCIAPASPRFSPRATLDCDCALSEGLERYNNAHDPGHSDRTGIHTLPLPRGLRGRATTGRTARGMHTDIGRPLDENMDKELRPRSARESTIDAIDESTGDVFSRADGHVTQLTQDRAPASIRMTPTVYEFGQAHARVAIDRTRHHAADSRRGGRRGETRSSSTQSPKAVAHQGYP